MINTRQRLGCWGGTMIAAREARHPTLALGRYGCYFANFWMTSSMLVLAVARYQSISTSLAGTWRIGSPWILAKVDSTRARRKSRLRSIPLPLPTRRTPQEERVCSTLLCHSGYLSSVLCQCLTGFAHHIGHWWPLRIATSVLEAPRHLRLRRFRRAKRLLG